ncbi:hypothetical protein [Ramlibacter lithotrophicus]|uniref:hypothetical protein n=1 Tax=Ramlibacter lithotrophicus TaxID=2606681 RepID=UPI001EE19D21|nr:hypothetical protein [Ramlibacter lithotrophicus]
MNAMTIAVDLAKTAFQLAEADDTWQIVRTHRLTRRQFERFFANRHVKLVIMEACGSAHYWAHCRLRRFHVGTGPRGPLKMPDIRLQALPQASHIDQPLAVGGESI